MSDLSDLVSKKMDSDGQRQRCRRTDNNNNIDGIVEIVIIIIYHGSRPLLGITHLHKAQSKAMLHSLCKYLTMLN